MGTLAAFEAPNPPRRRLEALGAGAVVEAWASFVLSICYDIL